MKVCTNCGVKKSYESYWKEGKDRRKKQCKECLNQKRRDRVGARRNLKELIVIFDESRTVEDWLSGKCPRM